MPHLVCTNWNGRRLFHIDHVVERRIERDVGEPVGRPIALTDSEACAGIDVLIIAAGEGKLASQKVTHR
jgi:hypothetical protein